MKSRLEALERLLGALQSKTPEEAELLLRRIRSADEFASLSTSAGDGGGINKALISLINESISTTSRDSSSSSPPPARRSTSPEMMVPLPLPSPSAQTLAGASDHLIRLWMPNAESSRVAIRIFYQEAGKVFHVFSEQQVEAYLALAFEPHGRMGVSWRSALCCVCVVAALGAQCRPSDFDTGTHRTYYDIANLCFASVVSNPLEHIKVCSLLAMYNILEKATVGLAFVGKS